jgi:2-polyprenyl-6-methoxyphenol hydroxylase-like FAD-dependent oxidoreductase
MAGRPTAELPILIIGAGVAGLTLAQGLRLRAVPFFIFERSPSTSNTKQGHRFRISADGQAALHSVLSPSLQDLLQRTTAERTRFAPRYIDSRTLSFPPRETVDPAGSMPVDRAWIRMLAMLDLGDALCFEKEFESYDTIDGVVQVRFTDGSIARGSILVGADGVKSRVRKQLQPDRKMLDLERWASK